MIYEYRLLDESTNYLTKNLEQHIILPLRNLDRQFHPKNTRKSSKSEESKKSIH